MRGELNFMSGVRIYDLAKELNVSSGDLLEMVKELGEPAKTASSTIKDDVAAAVRQRVAAKDGARSNGAAPSPPGKNGNAPSQPTGASPSGVPAPASKPAVAPKTVDVPDVVSLKDFADLIGVPAQ